MFFNSYQSGGYVEIFDSKITKENDKKLEKLLKIYNPQSVKKNYDKLIKGYIFEIDSGVNTRIQFPKDEKQDLGLVQRFLIFQINIVPYQAFSIEIVITDTSKTKRRINLTSAVSQVDQKYFHVKVPIDQLKRDVWLNLCIDVLSFMEVFKGSTFRSIDMIVVGSACKLRRIFTMRQPLQVFNDEGFEEIIMENSTQVPKNLNFLPNVPYQNQIFTFQMVKSLCQDITEISTSGTNSNIQLKPKKREGTSSSSTKPFKKTFQTNNNLESSNDEDLDINKKFPTILKIKNLKVDDKSPKNISRASPSMTRMTDQQSRNKSRQKNPWDVDKKSSPEKIQKQSKISLNSQKSPVKRGLYGKNQQQQVAKQEINFESSDDRFQKYDNNELLNNIVKKTNQSKNNQKQNNKKSDISDDEYLEKTSRFNTLNDPRSFTPDIIYKQHQFSKLQDSPKCSDDDEIEENLENEKQSQPIETNQKNHRDDQFRNIYQQTDGKKVITPYKMTRTKPQFGKKEYLDDSLEEINQRDQGLRETIDQNNVFSCKDYENEIQNIIQEDIRPYSPPFNSNLMKKTSLNNKKVEQMQKNKVEEDNMIEVVFDPILNCFYDPITNSYYDMKK